MKEAGQKDEPDLWLRRVGHLDGLDGEKPTSAVGLIQEDGQALGGWPRRRKARPGRRWWATRRCSRSTARRRAPFDGRMEEDGRERYVEVFGKVLCCIWRTQKRDENEGPAV